MIDYSGDASVGIILVKLQLFKIKNVKANLAKTEKKKKKFCLYSTNGLVCAEVSWRRVWEPTPVFLPGESPGLRSLCVSRGGRSP